MLARQGVRSGLRSWAAARPILARTYAEEAAAKAPAGEAQISEQFKQDWKKVAPNYDLPHFPSNFMVARPPVPSTIPAKLTLNFVLPHMFEMQAKPVSNLFTQFHHFYELESTKKTMTWSLFYIVAK
jgi:hypothetical protein